MAALESIARQVGLSETSARKVTPAAERTVEKLLTLARSNDHKFIKTEADKRNYAHWRDFRIKHVADALERVVADIHADHIDLENIKQLFHQLKIFHWDAHYAAKRFQKNDIVVGDKTEASNKVEDECWKRIKTSLQKSSESTRERFIEWIKIHQSKQYEEEQRYGGSVHSMIGGLPELGKRR